jgi:hypothetical protein
MKLSIATSRLVRGTAAVVAMSASTGCGGARVATPQNTTLASAEAPATELVTGDAPTNVTTSGGSTTEYAFEGEGVIAPGCGRG